MSATSLKTETNLPRLGRFSGSRSRACLFGLGAGVLASGHRPGGHQPHTMKNKILLLGCLLATATLALFNTGCAHVRDTSASKHEIKQWAFVAPAGYTIVTASVTNSATGNQMTQVIARCDGTNANGFWGNLTAPGVRRYLAYDEVWSDTSAGGGTFVFTDPAASQCNFARANQTALGGGHNADVGNLSSTITTNAVAAINAAATAAANVISQAVQAAAK